MDIIDEKNIDQKWTFKRVIMLIGLILIIAGLILFFLNAHFGNNEGNYTVKSSKEYSIIEASGVAIDSMGNVYCLSNYWSAVNVYSSNGDFLYSISVPQNQNGRNEMFIKNDFLFLVDKNHVIYYYADGEFRGKAEPDEGGISVYDENDDLLYIAPYPDDEEICAPLYVDGDTLYAESSNYILEYKNGVLVSEEPEDENNPIYVYAENSAQDNDGNVYNITGLIPKLVKTSVDNEKTIIAADSFIEWVTHQSFVCLFITIIGILVTTLFSRLKG